MKQKCETVEGTTTTPELYSYDIGKASEPIFHPRMALAGHWNQFPIPLESPPAIQIHAAFRDARSSGKVLWLIVNHRPDLPSTRSVLYSHCNILEGLLETGYLTFHLATFGKVTA